MQKRGQATLFIILGIILVAIVALIMFSKQANIYTPATQENLQGKMEAIEENIQDCLEDAAQEPLNRIMQQGGYLVTIPGSYRLWNDTSISYLCWNQEGQRPCMNRLLTREHMQDQLDVAIKQNVETCLNVQEEADLIQTYDLILPKDYNAKTTIEQDKVLATLEYPITLRSKSGDAQVSRKEFTKIFNVPLGELYDVSQDIVNAEATGFFDPLTYMLSKYSRYTIYTQKPYPDTVYRIKLREGSHVFQMAIQGEAA